MSSLHVQVNELELDQITKYPDQHSAHWTCVKHRQPNQLLRLRWIFCLQFFSKYVHNCVKHFMILLLVTTSMTFTAMATVNFAHFSCNRSMNTFTKKMEKIIAQSTFKHFHVQTAESSCCRLP